MGMGFQPQALRLQRDGAAAREGIEKDKRPVPHVFFDFGAGRVQDGVIVGVFPLHQLDKQRVQPLPFFFLFLFGGEQLRVRRGIIHQRRPENGACRSRRFTRPPQMQGGGVPVADGFFPCGCRVDGIQRQGDFNELFGGLAHG
ncbi:hypothetical protein [Desulfovibrio sp. ZJ200]|uniref:hypothetical protein n=1 Tax=Desulfovibrio sp. ZJ200 TaxID=2709792 RepID=UPI001F14ADCF|nr:hypothetical protein [Desulfovibrio sp. ZJ200]